MICPGCTAEVSSEAKFCTACGLPLKINRCPACGAPHEPGQKFCGECGAALASAAPLAERSSATELRFVSVLFVDVVGFTTLSEQVAAEDIRELLGSYFERARGIVQRYGGSLEKFIGDAVMAVWGVPVAREDDAERAVRAGLEVVDAVAALGAEVGLPELRARGGVVTGQAASVSRPGEGLVVGDRVNTAARAQSAASPGTVLVDSLTREATEMAIAYEDAGEHELKGKSEPLRLWRAERVVAGLGGTQRELGLEAPLIGRESRLRLLKELFHDAFARRAAHLVAISGEAGIGKSRLLREFDNYADGLADSVLWHTGYCRPYGEGVAYGALAEMFRQRLGVAQDAPTGEVQARLSAGLDRWIADAGEREFLTPRLGALLGVAEPDLPRAELFAGWRMFIERLAERVPVVLVFENLQWAEEGLLDFIEHLMDWSATSPIFVLALPRPELDAQRDGWPPAGRSRSVLQIEPLDDDEMALLLAAVVKALPRRVLTNIVKRAQGVPLYALETLRVLASRGQLVERDGALVPAGELDELDVPASLNSLLAARLDALALSERRLVKAMAVFGDTFPKAAAIALGDLPEQHLDEVLASLVRKQVLSIAADPLSPDRGQYRFSQGLLRTVAYEMLSRHERKPRHRAAAEYLAQAFPDDASLSEMIAAHYVDAFRAAGNDGDSAELRSLALGSLRRAAQRAISVGAPDTAERTYRTAAEIAEGDERREFQRAAAEMALQAGHVESALGLLEDAARAQLEEGRTLEAARLGALIGEALHRLERNEEAIERVQEILEILGDQCDGPEAGALYGVLGKALLYCGSFDQATEPLDNALRIARRHHLPAVESRALIDEGVIAAQSGRPKDARTLLEAALCIADRERLGEELILAGGNMANLSMQWDMAEAAEQYADVLARARRQGDRLRESIAAGQLASIHLYAGRWANLEELAGGLLEEFDERPGAEFLRFPLVTLSILQGDIEAARTHLLGMRAWKRGDDDELRAAHASLQVALALAEDEPGKALECGRPILAVAVEVLGVTHDAVRNAWPDMLESALMLGRRQAADELLALLGSQRLERLPPYLQAQLARGRGLLATARGDSAQADTELTRAEASFVDLGFTYWAARARLDRASALLAQAEAGQAASLLHRANVTFAELGARPALQRTRALMNAVPQDMPEHDARRAAADA